MGAFDCLAEEKIDDQAIAAFDKAAAVFEPDKDLIAGMPARRLGEQIEELIATVNALHLDQVRRRFNWYEKFTGLDLKARIEFDLSLRAVDKEMTETAAAAKRSRHALALLKAEFPKLKKVHARQAALIKDTRIFLNTATGDEFHVSRLERRLVNLETMHATNKMTAQQLKLAAQSLVSLIDRFNDVETLLFPLWQQQALAVSQAPADLGTGKNTLEKFSSLNDELTQKLAS